MRKKSYFSKIAGSTLPSLMPPRILFPPSPLPVDVTCTEIAKVARPSIVSPTSVASPEGSSSAVELPRPVAPSPRSAPATAMPTRPHIARDVSQEIAPLQPIPEPRRFSSSILELQPPQKPDNKPRIHELPHEPAKAVGKPDTVVQLGEIKATSKAETANPHSDPTPILAIGEDRTHATRARPAERPDPRLDVKSPPPFVLTPPAVPVARERLRGNDGGSAVHIGTLEVRIIPPPVTAAPPVIRVQQQPLSRKPSLLSQSFRSFGLTQG